MKRQIIAFWMLLAVGLAGEPQRGPGRVIERDGKLWLYGGQPTQDFDVTQFLDQFLFVPHQGFEIGHAGGAPNSATSCP